MSSALLELASKLAAQISDLSEIHDRLITTALYADEHQRISRASQANRSSELSASAAIFESKRAIFEPVRNSPQPQAHALCLCDRCSDAFRSPIELRRHQVSMHRMDGMDARYVPPTDAAAAPSAVSRSTSATDCLCSSCFRVFCTADELKTHRAATSHTVSMEDAAAALLAAEAELGATPDDIIKSHNFLVASARDNIAQAEPDPAGAYSTAFLCPLCFRAFCTAGELKDHQTAKSHNVDVKDAAAALLIAESKFDAMTDSNKITSHNLLVASARVKIAQSDCDPADDPSTAFICTSCFKAFCTADELEAHQRSTSHNVEIEDAKAALLAAEIKLEPAPDDIVASHNFLMALARNSIALAEPAPISPTYVRVDSDNLTDTPPPSTDAKRMHELCVNMLPLNLPGDLGPEMTFYADVRPGGESRFWLPFHNRRAIDGTSAVKLFSSSDQFSSRSSVFQLKGTGVLYNAQTGIPEATQSEANSWKAISWNGIHVSHGVASTKKKALRIAHCQLLLDLATRA